MKLNIFNRKILFYKFNLFLALLCFSFPLTTLANVSDQSEVPILQATSQNSVNAQPLAMGFATSAASSTTPDSFVRYFRYPIESPSNYITMDEIEPAPTATAYYRDVYAGAETRLSVSDSVTNKTWTVEWLLSDNKVRTSTIQFVKSYNGYSNCFIGARVLCGITSIRAYWHFPARCQPAGTYTMAFYDNGIQYDQRQFKLLAQIKSDNIPIYNQDDYPNDLMGGIPFLQPSIESEGCLLTSLAMILSYHDIKGSSGGLITPKELNDKLKEVGGYTLRSQIIWDSIAEITGGKVKFDRSLSFSNIKNNICRYGPQPVSAEGSLGFDESHWMVATGLNNSNEYLVNDPKSSRDQYYGESWVPTNTTRGIVGPEIKTTDVSGISIWLHSPAELLVTDPQGRRLGIDPSTGESFKEIPSSLYGLSGVTDQVTGHTREQSKILSFGKPIEGEYMLEAIGTGTGSYDLEIHAMDNTSQRSSAMVLQVPIVPGERHAYRFNFSGASTAPLDFIASYLGGGQNTKVNSILSYSAPQFSKTTLPTGTDTYTASIFYSRNIIPQSFQAELNGTDISSIFHPMSGTNERVALPLVSGRNVLKLKVEGDIGSRIATDSDRLVFIIP